MSKKEESKPQVAEATPRTLAVIAEYISTMYNVYGFGVFHNAAEMIVNDVGKQPYPDVIKGISKYTMSAMFKDMVRIAEIAAKVAPRVGFDVVTESDTVDGESVTSGLSIRIRFNNNIVGASSIIILGTIIPLKTPNDKTINIPYPWVKTPPGLVSTYLHQLMEFIDAYGRVMKGAHEVDVTVADSTFHGWQFMAVRDNMQHLDLNNDEYYISVTFNTDDFKTELALEDRAIAAPTTIN